MNNLLSSLADLDYYFNTRPSTGNFNLLLPLVIFFGVLFIAGVYFRFFYVTSYRREKHFALLGEKISSWLFTSSILGLIYLFMRYEGIVYLSARVLLYLIILYFIVVGIRIYRFYQTEFFVLKKQHQENQHKTSYMPKKRKKNRQK
jgi:hypothetical protein